jgi:SAM-dependent methyltransferase
MMHTGSVTNSTTTVPVEAGAIEASAVMESSTQSVALMQQHMATAANPGTASLSDFRRVFQTSDQMKAKFAKFLTTIFYQLDEKKVFALMEKLLADPEKSDEQVYRELLAQIGSVKKSVPILSKLWSLYVLKSGMAKQAAQLMKQFRKERFHDYMEIYDRRYANNLRSTAGLPLDGKVIGVSNSSEVGIADRIQASALLSKYPYTQHEPLNDPGCKDPFMHPEMSYKPLPENIKDNSIDLIGCLGGLHHTPPERMEAFADSMHKKLRPGGVILMRDHNIDQAEGLSAQDVKAIAAVVHSFVNAADGVECEVEQKEVREFKSVSDWTKLMEKHGFKRISNEQLVLKDDPTENAMFAFIKAPTNLEELRQATAYRSDCQRPKIGTWATWIEWANVRFSKQYAEYIQDHHAYAFDHVGHLRQHRQHFFQFVKEARKSPDVRLDELLFSDNMAMNLFILSAAAFQCCSGALASFPAASLARMKHGDAWRNAVNLTDLEKFEARYQKEYSDFIDHTPFYMYDYLGKMREMFKVVAGSQESVGTKIASTLSAAVSSLGFIGQAMVCTPIRSFYTAEANLEPDTIKILIKDPKNELETVMAQWEKEKDPQHDSQKKISVIYETPDGHKLVSLPRYRPFTKICGYLSDTEQLQLLEIGSQKEISVDLLLKKDQADHLVEGARKVYEMEKLQDAEKRRYATYQTHVSALKQFERTVGKDSIEYIHE